MKQTQERNDCRSMAALGIEVVNDQLELIAPREEIREFIINRMKAARLLFYDDGPLIDSEGKPTALANMRRIYLDKTDEPAQRFTVETMQLKYIDPLKEQLSWYMTMFEKQANQFFEQDPPIGSVLDLPRNTFAEVEWFFDIEALCHEADYPFEGIERVEDGEQSDNEMNRNRSRRETAADNAGAVARSEEDQPKPAPATSKKTETQDTNPLADVTDRVEQTVGKSK